MYQPIPRPTTTPDIRERARALLSAAQRKQNLYAQALVQTEMGQSNSMRSAAIPSTAPTASGGLDQLVQHLTHASDQDLLRTNQTLTQAREQAHHLAAGDAELQAILTAAYGLPPAAPANSPGSDVVDVQVREIPPDPEKLPPQTP